MGAAERGADRAGGEHVVLRAGGHWLAVPAAAVRQVVTLGAVARAPRSPAWLVGLTVIEGRPLPVVSAQRLLGEEEAATPGAMLPRLVVVGGAEGEVALVADEAVGVVEVEAVAAAAAGDRGPDWTRGEVSWRGRAARVVDPEALAQAVLRAVAAGP